MLDYCKFILGVLIATNVLAGEPHLTVEPRELRGVPGEPLRVELTAETDRANPIQLRVPAVSNLVLRTVEKVPITRTAEGTYIQKRIVIWQGVEAGSITLTNLTIVFQGLENNTGESSASSQGLENFEAKFPTLGITVDEVTPALPPEKEKAE